MKNLYLEKMKTMGFAALLLLGSAGMFAQTTVNWKGTNTDDADDLNNWAELTNMAGNNVVVGHVNTYADPANPKHPVTRSGNEVSILNFGVVGQTTITGVDGEGNPTSVTYDGGVFTVDKPAGVALKVNPASNGSTYLGGSLIVKSGSFVYNTNRNFYVENPNSRVIVEGTGVMTTGLFLMGRNSGTLTGGQIQIKNDGYLGCTNVDRFVPDVTQSLITISDNGKFRVNNDKRTYLKDKMFVTGQIRGGEGFVVYMYYDNVPNQTFVVAKSAAVPFIYTTDHMVLATERLKANEVGTQIAVLPNPAILTNAQSIVWKYGTSVDGPFDMTMAGMVNDTISPVFPDLGTYYLVCEVTKEGGDKVVSTPRQYIISTDKVTLSPAGKQYLRLGQSTGVISVNETGTATAREWKYTTTPGENYMSFDPVQTGTTLSTSFPATGSYYVVCESTIDGVSLRSKETEVLVQKMSDGALNVTWTGAVDDKVENIFNWNPYAYIAKNNAIVPVTGITNWPVFSTGVDTIMGGSGIYPGAKLYVRGKSIEDTLKLRNDIYGIDGDLIVESGVFVKDVSFFRLDVSTAKLIVKGTGKAVMNATVMMGNNNTPTDGGFIEVSENGTVVFNELPGRMSADATKTFGKIIVSGNGTAMFKGNQFTQVSSWVSLARIVTVEGYALKYNYDPTTDYTYVQARDLAGFAITQTKTQYVGPDQLTSDLTLDNASGYSNFEWQYSTNPFGPYESFSTPVTGEIAKVSFPVAGTYFVICKAGDGTYTNNVLRVSIVELPIAVTVVDGAEVLTVTLPAGATGVQWKFRLANTGAYEEFAIPVTTVAYTPLAEEYPGDGTYQVVFEATVKNDDAQDVTILSKPVEIVIAGGALDVITTGVQGAKVEKLGIYPNPSTGTFNITAVKGGKVEVLDLKGAVVLSQTVSAGVQSITVASKGVYLVKVIDGAQVKIGRVVVK